MEVNAFNTDQHGGSGNHPQLQQNLPNANLILLLGILSIVLCWWHLVSIAGIVLGTVTIALARKEVALYHSSPERFTVSSLNNVRTGRTCAVIGLIISIVIFILVSLFLIGMLASLPFMGMIR